MKAGRLIATAMIAVGATVVAGTTTSAQPQPGAPATDPNTPVRVAHGTDHGVGYTITDTRRDSTMITTIDSGRFVMDDRGRTITVSNRDGSPVAVMPTALRLHNHLYNLRPDIDPTGRTLILKPIDAFDHDQTHPSPTELVGAVVCGVIGGLAGLFVGILAGTVIGLLFLILGAIPGVFIGAFLGAFFGAGVGVRACFDLGGAIH